MEKKWSIGIDPGFRETGVVLGCEEGTEYKLVEWVTFSCPADNYEDLSRAAALGEVVVDEVVRMIDMYHIKQLDVSMETPIYRHNAATLMKQIRLYQEIQSGLLFCVTGQVEQFWLTEVYPATSKSLLTGNGKANKADMIAGFKVDTGIELEGESVHTAETVADAYAHSLACWLPTQHRINMTILQAAVVSETGRGEQ